MKKYYFYSYVVANNIGNSVKHSFANAVVEMHPFEAINTMNKSFQSTQIPGIMNSQAILLNWREISEKEYLLFQN